MCTMSSAPLGDVPAHLFTAIDHVGIAVPDLDAAIAFYRDTYGMRLAHEETNEEQGVREAMIAVGESGSCIQLLAPLNEESTIAKFLDRSGPGVQQMAYRVTDVEAVSAILRERGMRLLYDVARPELGPGEALVAVMASAINYNTVWTSIFEPVSTFGFLERYGKLSPLTKRHDLP